MTFPYNTAVPNGPDDPADDQPFMQTNTLSISQLISVDHNGFNTNGVLQPGGYHKVIHFQNNGVTIPPTIAGFGQLYTNTVTVSSIADQQLFYKSGNGIITQLTGPNSPLASTNGYVWLFGSILLQWGRKSFSGSGNQNVAINYVAEGNIAMPNSTFVAFATLHPTGGSVSSTAQISTRQRTASGFSVHYTGSGDYDEFQWFAIGN